MNHLKRAVCSLASGILLLCSASAGMPVSAADNTFTDKTFTYEKIDGGVRITKVEAGTITVNVNKQVDGFQILEIGPQAFSGCSRLTEVTLSDGLKKIDKGAFSGCMNLKSINIPETVTEIGDGAFYYCGSLKEITVPDSVEKLGNTVFSNCFSLETVKLPDSLKTIPAYSFYYDIVLKNLELPKNLETIATTSFVECYLLDHLDIPASVTTIEPAAFIGCSGIKAYQIDEKNTAYHTDDAGAIYTADNKTLLFYPAGSEAKEYTVPDGVEEISLYACAGAVSLETLNLPASVTKLGAGMLSDCTSLKAFSFPAGIDAIPDSMFANSSVSALTIPETVTQIGEFSFFNCKNLTEITIPEGVTAIGAEAFFGCTGVSAVRVPDAVTSVGDYAFGFYLQDDAADNASPILMENFTLSGAPNSAAKKYASENGVKFHQIGIDMQTILYIVIGVLLAVFIVLTVIFIKRGAKKRAAVQAALPPEEPDPNYQSILDESDE